MSGKPIPVGERIGMLTVLQEAPGEGDGVRALCLCDCGRVRSLRMVELRRSGRRQRRSCGCQARKLHDGPPLPPDPLRRAALSLITDAPGSVEESISREMLLHVAATLRVGT